MVEKRPTQRFLGGLVALVALIASSTLVGCSGDRLDDPQQILQRFAGAVHARDYDALAIVDASAPDPADEAAFEAWIVDFETLLASYEAQRDGGMIAPDDHGYAIVRASQLGKGLFWAEVARETRGSELIVRVRANFGYGSATYGTYPRGTMVYLMGYPLGKIHRIRLGDSIRHEMDVLEHLDFEVRFVPAGPDHPEVAYRVAGIEWIEGSAQHGLVSWIF